VHGFYASLYLNLAQDHHKLGATEQAREHLALAEHAAADLPGDGYGIRARSGVAEMGDRLSTSD
jgi:hypothetical protein